MDDSIKGSIVAVLAAFTLGAGAVKAEDGPSSGQTTEPLRAQRAVAYGDLNLASTAGQEALQQRIRAAARQVCGTTSYRNAGGLSTAAANRRCIDEAIAEARSAIDVKTRSLASTR